MKQIFVNRNQELNFLEEFFTNKTGDLLIIYGRRRIGKTELIQKFIEDKKALYFLAIDAQRTENIKIFQSQISGYFDNQLFEQANFQSWDKFLDAFTNLFPSERFIIIFDEFPYLIKNDSSVLSQFQRIWDLQWKLKNILVILCGSSISMMEKAAFDKSSPIYGRRTGQWKVLPLSFYHLKELYPDYSNIELSQVFGIIDCIPAYLEKFDSSLSVFDNIKYNLAKKGSFLYEEVEFLLRYAIREPGRYYEILKAIAFGFTQVGKICAFVGYDKSIVSRYLSKLEELHVVKRYYPITDKREKQRNLRYDFDDNYFKFWFRFIYPYRYLIELNNYNSFQKELDKFFSTYMGKVFENLCQRIISEKIDEFSNFFHLKQPVRIGPWWNKGNEIDLIVISEESKKSIIIECKWKKLKKIDINRLIVKLKEKSEDNLPELNGYNKKILILAKSYEFDEKYEDVFLWTIDDLVTDY